MRLLLGGTSTRIASYRIPNRYQLHGSRGPQDDMSSATQQPAGPYQDNMVITEELTAPLSPDKTNSINVKFAE